MQTTSRDHADVLWSQWCLTDLFLFLFFPSILFLSFFNLIPLSIYAFIYQHLHPYVFLSIYLPVHPYIHLSTTRLSLYSATLCLFFTHCTTEVREDETGTLRCLITSI